MDPAANRPQLRVHADTPAAGAVPGSADDRVRAVEPARLRARARHHTRHVALERLAAQEPGSARRRDGRSDRRGADRAELALALARNRDRSRGWRRRLRQRLRLQLRPDNFVPNADDAVADGGQSAQAVSPVIRPGRFSGRA